MRVIVLVCIALAVTLSAQAPRPAFEVASVKKLAQRIAQSPSQAYTRSAALYFANVTVAGLVQYAYDVRDFALVGGPDWTRQDLFEVNARAAAEVSADEKRLMVQSLLADRFKLVVRKDKQEMEFSQLVLARSDGRLGPNFTDCPDPNVKSPPPRAPRGGMLWVVTCGTTADLVQIASINLRTPVVDKTGLTGRWHVEITFIDPRRPPSAGGAPAADIDPNLTEMRTALQEQLGLKLESARGPVDVLVVESVEQPTPD
jgi:uncharacterized protein (TIGR03435 family)